MEKYAVDLKSIPPTDEQFIAIKKLCKLNGVENDFMVKTASEAEGIIKQLELRN